MNSCKSSPKTEKEEIKKTDLYYFPPIPAIAAENGELYIQYDEAGNITFIPNWLVIQFLDYFRLTEAAIEAVTYPP